MWRRGFNRMASTSARASAPMVNSWATGFGMGSSEAPMKPSPLKKRRPQMMLTRRCSHWSALAWCDGLTPRAADGSTAAGRAITG